MSWRGILRKAGIVVENNTVTFDKSRDVYVRLTSALTTGTIRGLNNALTMTGASSANIVEAFRSSITANVKTGAWANAIVGSIDYSTSGAAHGMAAAICAEMIPPNSSLARGALYALDIVFGCGASSSWGSAGPCAFMHLENWGTKAHFSANAFLFHLAGETAASGGLLSANSRTLRVRIGTTTKYLYLSDTEDDLGSMVVDTISVVMAGTDGINLSGTASDCGIEIDGATADGIRIDGTCSDNGIEIVGVATGAGILIDYTIAVTTTRALHINMDTSVTSGNCVCMELAYTNSASGINNMRAFTSDLVMGAGCAGPYAGYFRVDCVTYQVGGLGAALGTEVCLPGATVASGEFHNITLDFECPTSFVIGAGKHSFIKCEIWGETTPKNSFDDAFNLFFLNGMTSAAGNMISADEQTIRINIEATSRYLMLSHAENYLSLTGTMVDAIVISGTCSDNAIEITSVAQGAGILIDYAIPTATSYALHIDCDTALAAGDVECMVLALTNSAAGINNLRAFTSDLVMGAACNGPYAGYFRTDCVGFQVGGLGAALGLEVCLPGVTLASGQFHGMTIDFECPTGLAGLGSAGAGLHSFIKMEIWGETTEKNLFDDGFNLFYFNGISAGNGSMFDSQASTVAAAVEHSLRININGTAYYIPLCANPTCVA